MIQSLTISPNANGTTVIYHATSIITQRPHQLIQGCLKRGHGFDRELEDVYGEAWKEKREGTDDIIILYSQKS